MTVPENPPVQRQVGAYRIVDVLARGGMAIVYRALQPALDREVALKELASFPHDEADLAERFLRESRVAGSLQNEHIVHVHDYFEHDGVPYIAMELLERGSLRSYVGCLTIAQVAGVLEGVLAGLAHAHAHGIIHRDLKPENVLVSSDGAVKIADFGIAKARRRVWRHLTATGTTLGTSSYMAPEQAKGGDVWPQTDLYAVGVIAYEMLLGSPPFPGTDEPMAVMMQHIAEPVQPPRELDPEIDEELEAWILRLLAKDPGDRPASAAEAWDRLEHIVVRLEGSFWRRDARLGPPGQADEPAAESRPLSEAEFPSVVTPVDGVQDYVTFRPAEPADLPSPEPEPQTPDPVVPPPPAHTPPIARPAPRRIGLEPQPEDAFTIPPQAPPPLPDQPQWQDAFTIPPQVAEPRRRRRGRVALVVAAIALAAAGGAAGVMQMTGSPSVPALDLAPVEAQIRNHLEPASSVERVSCPPAPRQQGHVMECVATLAGDQRLQVTVEQLDGTGRVRVQPHL
jgi:serine/threonine protein kinase